MLSSAKLVRVVDAECLIILCKCYPIFAQNILNYPGDGIGFQSPANLKHPINETNTTRNHYHKSGKYSGVYKFKGVNRSTLEKNCEMSKLIPPDFSLKEQNPVSDRIITARFLSKLRNTTLSQCYASTEITNNDD